MEKPDQRTDKENSEIQTRGSFCGRKSVCRISDRAFTSKKTHTGTDTGAKRREETDHADSVRIMRNFTGQL